MALSAAYQLGFDKAVQIGKLPAFNACPFEVEDYDGYCDYHQGCSAGAAVHHQNCLDATRERLRPHGLAHLATA